MHAIVHNQNKFLFFAPIQSNLLKIKMATFIVVDIETNAIGTFRPPTQTPIQIAWEKLNQYGEVLDKACCFIKGVEHINEKYQPLFTVEQVNSEGVAMEIVMTYFVSLIEPNTVLVAHNADFDVGLLERCAINEHQRNQIRGCKKFCTLTASTIFCKLFNPWKPNSYKYPKLSELAAKCEIPFDQSKLHDAQYDVELCRACFLHMSREGWINCGIEERSDDDADDDEDNMENWSLLDLESKE